MNKWDEFFLHVGYGAVALLVGLALVCLWAVIYVNVDDWLWRRKHKRWSKD